eukprot:6456117-Amphidinium_carterae.2
MDRHAAYDARHDRCHRIALRILQSDMTSSVRRSGNQRANSCLVQWRAILVAPPRTQSRATAALKRVHALNVCSAKKFTPLLHAEDIKTETRSDLADLVLTEQLNVCRQPPLGADEAHDAHPCYSASTLSELRECGL